MNASKLIPVLILLLFGMASMAIAGEEVIENGVVYVINGNVPSQGTKTIEFKELWRIGGEDDSVILKSITKVLLGRDNNIYFLDGQDSMIYVYDFRNGDRLREWRVFGEGPGEVYSPQDMVLIKENIIGLLKALPAKIVCLDYNFNPSESFFLSDDSNPFIARHVDWENGLTVVAGNGFSKKNLRGETFLTQCSQYGEVKRYITFDMESNPYEGQEEIFESDFYFSLTKPWDMTIDGQLFVSPYWNGMDSQYVINVYNRNAELSRVIKRKFDARKRSDDDIIKSLGLGAYINEGGNCRLEDFHPDILEIHSHPDGNIWVRTSRSDYEQASGVLRIYDVFSLKGHFIQQVSLLLNGNSYKDIVYFLDENTIAIVKGQVDVMNKGVFPKEDLLELIVYSMK